MIPNAISEGFIEHVPDLKSAQVFVIGCDRVASDDHARVFLEKRGFLIHQLGCPVTLEHIDTFFLKIQE